MSAIIGDYFFQLNNFADAVRIFFHGRNVGLAIYATEKYIVAYRNYPNGGIILQDIVNLRKKDNTTKKELSIESGSYLLVVLFTSPGEASMKYAAQCLQTFGSSIIKHAVQKIFFFV